MMKRVFLGVLVLTSAPCEFTDSTGTTVVVGKDGKITVPGVTQDPSAP